jgi:putative flippase GtrA
MDAVSPALPPVPSEQAVFTDWAHGFMLHVVTGFAAVGVHYSVMWLLVKLSVGPLTASGVGFTGGAITRFLLSHFKVFTPTGSVPAALIKFLAALAGQMGTNLVLLELFMRLGASLWLSQFLATIILTFFNYLIYRLWVFR